MEGIIRCQDCAAATFSYITRERQHLEERILSLSSELTNLESFCNVLDLQMSRPPLRQVALPQDHVDLRIKLVAAFKAQIKIIRALIAYYTNGMMTISTEQYQAIEQLTQ